MGHIQASTSMWPGYPERLEVYGEKGSIILEAGSITKFNIEGSDSVQSEASSGTSSGSSDPMAISYEPHKRQIMDFARAIWEGEPPAVDGEEGRKAVAIIEAIYTSSRNNSPARLK